MIEISWGLIWLGACVVMIVGFILGAIFRNWYYEDEFNHLRSIIHEQKRILVPEYQLIKWLEAQLSLNRSGYDQAVHVGNLMLKEYYAGKVMAFEDALARIRGEI